MPSKRNYWMEVQGQDHQLLQYYHSVAQTEGMYCTQVRFDEPTQIIVFRYAHPTESHLEQPLIRIHNLVGTTGGFWLHYEGDGKG